MAPPGKPPGIWLFLKNFGQIPRYVDSLDGQMTHRPGCIPCTSHAEDTPRVSKLYAKRPPRHRRQQPRPQSSS